MRRKKTWKPLFNKPLWHISFSLSLYITNAQEVRFGWCENGVRATSWCSSHTAAGAKIHNQLKIFHHHATELQDVSTAILAREQRWEQNRERKGGCSSKDNMPIFSLCVLEQIPLVPPHERRVARYTRQELINIFTFNTPLICRSCINSIYGRDERCGRWDVESREQVRPWNPNERSTGHAAAVVAANARKESESRYY